MMETYSLSLLGNAILFGPSGLSAALNEWGEAFVPKTEVSGALVVLPHLRNALQEEGAATGELESSLWDPIASEADARVQLKKWAAILKGYPREIFEKAADKTVFSLNAVTSFLSSEHARVKASRILKSFAEGERTGSTDFALRQAEADYRRLLEAGISALGNRMPVAAYQAFSAIPCKSETGIPGLVCKASAELQLQRLIAAGATLDHATSKHLNTKPDRFNWSKLHQEPHALYLEDSHQMLEILRLKIYLLRSQYRFQDILEILGHFDPVALPPELTLELAVALKEAGHSAAGLVFQRGMKGIRQNQKLSGYFSDLFGKAGDRRYRYRIRETPLLTFREALLHQSLERIFNGQRQGDTTPRHLLEHLLDIPESRFVYAGYSSAEIANVLNSLVVRGEALDAEIIRENGELLKLERSEARLPGQSLPQNEFPLFAQWCWGYNTLFASDAEGRPWVVKSHSDEGAMQMNVSSVLFFSNGAETKKYPLSLSELETQLLRDSSSQIFADPVEAQQRLDRLKKAVDEKYERDVLGHEALRASSEEVRRELHRILTAPIWADDIREPILVAREWTKAGKPLFLKSRVSEWPISYFGKHRHTRFYFHPRGEFQNTAPTRDMFRAIAANTDSQLSRFFERAEAVIAAQHGSYRVIKDYKEGIGKITLFRGVWGCVISASTDAMPFGIRIRPFLQGTLAGKIVQYHEAHHILYQEFFEEPPFVPHFLAPLFGRKILRYQQNQERFAYWHQAQMLKSLGLTAGDLALMKAELVARGKNWVEAEKSTTGLFDGLWTGTPDEYVKHVLENGAVLEMLLG